MSSNTILSETIKNMFSANALAMSKDARAAIKLKEKGPSRQQLELAVAVLLTDLASCDENFDPREFEVIVGGMYRLFGTPRTEVEALVNQAKLTLGNLRGPAQFANMLRESLDLKQRNLIMEIIDETIMADNVEDGFETYIRQKCAETLGVTLEPIAAK